MDSCSGETRAFAVIGPANGCAQGNRERGRFSIITYNEVLNILLQVTHTNDLTALALTHSALHNLAIPHIYSRFDIVWPDAHATTDPRTGVDALTYGLSTLCMGDIYTTQSRHQSFTCKSCGTVNATKCSHDLRVGVGSGQRRLGNQYPQFTRKFSLGNGPADWVQEYLITKESGKMLGTLVALAVARMINLEAFVWDMPTGVLRDVWLALSSLQRWSPDQECRLERVWVRWHDNSDPANAPVAQPSGTAATTTPQMLNGSTLNSIGWTLPSNITHTPTTPRSYAQSPVEYPTLSVLPPLKSLSVLDIDELDYLDEMSVLIARSKDRLRELRVGISQKAITRDFAIPWDGPDLHQVDHKAQWPGASTIGERRLGGVLGVLLGRIFDIRKKQKVQKSDRKDLGTPSTTIPAEAPHNEIEVPFPISTQSDDNLLDQVSPHLPYATSVDGAWHGEKITPFSPEAPLSTSNFNIEGESFPQNSNELDYTPLPTTLATQVDSTQSDYHSLNALISAHTLHGPTNEPSQGTGQPQMTIDLPLRRAPAQQPKQSHPSDSSSKARERLDGKLRLQTLELERIPLSVAVLQKGFDWSVLTNLTILDCTQHDRLWIMLRRHFQPSPIGPASSKHASSVTLQYHLNLKKIHTDAASPSLISFLKETLAPNTLETLFLQDRKRSNAPSVTIVSIVKHDNLLVPS
jgi:hypothetical protein